MECQKDLKDPAEFLESVKVDLFQDEVYVFTPKGDVRVFPRGSTPIDFAYAIHSQVGEHCSGRARQRANRAAALQAAQRRRRRDHDHRRTSSRARTGSTSCVTTRARARIRGHLRAEQREKSIKLGKELLENEMHAAGMSFSKLVKNEAEVRRVYEAHSVQSLDELFLTIGYGKLQTEDVVDGLRGVKPDEGGDGEAPASLRSGRIEQFVRKVTGRDQAGIRLNGIDDVLVRYAKCCNPLPGDDIIGFITRGRGVTIHRRDCRKAFDTDPERRVEVSWDSKAKINRPVQLSVTTTNKPGILATVEPHLQQRRDQHQRGQLPRRRRWARAQYLHVHLYGSESAEERDEGVAEGEWGGRGGADLEGGARGVGWRRCGG